MAIDPIDDESVVIFHAGVIKKGGKMINVAGRVVSVCCPRSDTFRGAGEGLPAAPKVRFEGARYRTDIGYRALEQRAEASAGLNAL